MVSLGLVTHDHLEGKKNVVSWFLSSLLHGHSELEVQVQNISVLSAFGMPVLLILVSVVHPFYSPCYMDTDQLLMQLRSVVGKKVYVLVVGKKFVTVLLLLGQPLYLKSYAMDNFMVTHIWISYLFHDFMEL